MPKLLLPKICFTLLMLTIFLSACSSSNDQNQDAAPTAAPTLTTIPIYNFVQPTFPPQIQTMAAATAAAGIAAASTPATLEPGQNVYVSLACNTCHGDKGEGTDIGAALTSFSMSEENFVSFLRSGGSVGSTHVYAADRLSESDANILYEFLQSLVTK